MSGPWMAALISLWILMLVQGVLLLGLLRRVSIVLERAEQVRVGGAPSMGPPVGSALPSFTARGPDGDVIRSSELKGEAFVLLMLSSGCQPCRSLLEDVRQSDLSLLDVPLLAVIDRADSESETLLPAGVRVVYQKDGEVARALLTSATPFAFAVSRDGAITGSGVPSSVGDLASLAERARQVVDEETLNGQVAVRSSDGSV